MCPTWRRSKQPLVRMIFSPARRHSATRRARSAREKILAAASALAMVFPLGTSDNSGVQLVARHGSGSALHYDEAAGTVGGPWGFLRRAARGERGGESGDDGVAGAGDVRHLVG